MHRQSSLQLAYYGWRVKKLRGWTLTPMLDAEREYVQARGIPIRWWRECTRVGQVLEALTLEELSSIGLSRSQSITQINPEIWDDYDWMADARRLSAEKFDKLVRLRNAGNHDFPDEEEPEPVPMEAAPVEQVIAAAKHAQKLLKLADKALRKYPYASDTKFVRETRRLMDKARTRLNDTMRKAFPQPKPEIKSEPTSQHASHHTPQPSSEPRP